MLRFVRPFAAGLALAAPLSSVTAQAGVQPSPCTYERCVLRLYSGSPMAPQVVQGIEERSVVERVGGLTVRIPVLESSPDSVRVPYMTFQAHARVARGIFAVSALDAAVMMVVLARRPRSFNTIVPELGVGVALSIPIMIESAKAGNALETAVTRYNAALPNR